MKDLIIVGAGAVGREVLQGAKEINRLDCKWNIKGFIDDNQDALKNIECDYSVIGTIKDWTPQKHEVFLCGIGAPQIKQAVTYLLTERGATFETIISPKSCIGDFVTIGTGSIILGLSIISVNAKLGDFITVLSSMIGQESVIGDFSTTTGYTNVAGATLGKRVFAGSQSVILNDRIVGDDAYICAGSVVMRNVKSNSKVFGNPARKINI